MYNPEVFESVGSHSTYSTTHTNLLNWVSQCVSDFGSSEWVSERVRVREWVSVSKLLWVRMNVSEWKWVNESEWMSEWINEWVSEEVGEWVSKSE